MRNRNDRGAVRWNTCWYGWINKVVWWFDGSGVEGREGRCGCGCVKEKERKKDQDQDQE